MDALNLSPCSLSRNHRSQPHKYFQGSSSKFSSCCSYDPPTLLLIISFLIILFLLEEGSLVLSDMKDQEIIVDSPLQRESMGQSSGSTPTLPYSHRQAVLPILTISTVSFCTSVPQNVTTEHFPLVSSSSNSLYHSLLQPSSISLPDPPPYPSTILLTPLGPTLYGNHFSPIYPHTTPSFGSNPLVGSSLSFPQQIFFPNSSFSTLPFNIPTTFSNTNPIFTTISNIPKSSSDSLPQRRLTGGWQRGWSRGNTYYSTRKPNSQIFDSHTSFQQHCLFFLKCSLVWSFQTFLS